MPDWLIRSLPPLFRPHLAAEPTPDHGESFSRSLILLRRLRARALLRRAGDDELSGVSWFTFFVGWPRSGHSLLGSLLDAHPAFAIAHELDALPLVEAGFSREELFALIVDNSRRFAESPRGRGWSGYSYAVPDQWQGRWQDLHVVGDKKGGMSAHFLATINPDIVRDMRRRLRVPLRVIVYHRNPYDIIATVARRQSAAFVEEAMVAATLRNLVPAVDTVLDRCTPDEVTELYHEDFVASPASVLRAVVQSFGEDADPEYLRAATGIVSESPHRTRHNVRWRPEARRLAERTIADRSYLRRYSFET